MCPKHIPVLLKESINGLKIKSNGIYIDGTVGGGGHSFFIASELSSAGKLICIDQDSFALETAQKRLSEFRNKIIFVHDNFCNIKLVTYKNNFKYVDGILLDLGVSSFQIDDAERGFSYIRNSRLDMRMDKSKKLTAFDVINYWDTKKLEAIIKNYGEEKFYRSIANKISIARNIRPIETTFDLVDIIRFAVPNKFLYGNGHPAKKTFQAIRIAVNNELEILETTIIDCVDLLKSGGRLCIISFHSLEDRIIKNSFRTLSSPCTCPRDFPVCVCHKKALCNAVTRKPIYPSELEIKNNPRAHSAKLRIIEKI